GVHETPRGVDQRVDAWPVLAVDELRRLPELFARLHPNPRFTWGQYCARASPTTARAAMKFSNDALMFWLLTTSCSSSSFSSGSLNTSHHLPRIIASCGLATFHPGWSW